MVRVVDVFIERDDDANTVQSRYSWHDDFTISREHLRIHCILYEQNPVADIAPFVYATDLSANGTYLKKGNAECTGSQGRGILMGKNVTFLLDDGDELQLSETVTLIYRSLGEVKQTVLTSTQEREKASLASRYLITGRLLGEGGYGKVLIGVDQKTQRQLACKIVNLAKLYDRRADLRAPTRDGQWSSSQSISQLPARVQSCFREFDILKDLSHPNIVHIQKVFWSRSTIYMFQELVTGGDLFSYIEYKDGKIPSIEAAVIVRQILKGVQYLHDQDIVHRDLKPDNVLMTSLDSGARVVITDFGNARFLPNAKTQSGYTSNKLRRMFTTVGTLEYAAPEIHQANYEVPKTSGYSIGVDMWAIGSITAVVLTGEQLFACRRHDPDDDEARYVVIKLAAECDLSVLDDEYHPRWGAIDNRPKDFIKSLLVLNEEDRMSAAEALNHIWFTHPMMAAEFKAEYERAIRDWLPRRKTDQLIEQVPTLQADYDPRKAPNSRPVDGTSSRFFMARHAPVQALRLNDCKHMQVPRLSDQHTDQPVPFSYEHAYEDDRFQQYNRAEGYHQMTRRHDETANCFSNEEQTYAATAADDPQTVQRRICKHSNALAGQLKGVSTKTRGEYFQREIVDLDDLDSVSNVLEEDLDAPHVRYDTPRLRRQDTVQVRTTPGADSEGHGGVDLWWNSRYRQTQFHYDTQAEPMTQEKDDVVVHETPPEVFTQPQRPRAKPVDKRNFSLGEHTGGRRADEPSFAHKVVKQKKVYGRRR